MNSSSAEGRAGQGKLFSTQRERLLELFQEFEGQWVSLPTILKLGIAQYNTRILELRDSGYVIENKTGWSGKVKHSWFRYTGKRAVA